MALIDFIGFDNQVDNSYPIPFFQSYGVSSIYFDYTTNTRFGTGRALYISSGNYSNWFRKPLPSPLSSIIVGCAFKQTNAPGGDQLRFRFYSSDLAQFQFQVIFYDSGTVSVLRSNDVVLASVLGVFNPLIWNYFEVKGVLSNTTGACIVKINGSEIINISNVDTLYSGTDTDIEHFEMYCYNNTCYLDDIYIIDETGTTNNTFLGDVRVETIVPTANGTTNDGIASAGSNYECVDELPYSDTDYVTLDAVNEIELYTMGDLPSTSYTKSIHGIKSNFRSSRDASGARAIVSIVRVNSTNYVHTGDAYYLSSDYAINHKVFIWELNPDDSAAWEEADINAMEAGVKVAV